MTTAHKLSGGDVHSAGVHVRDGLYRGRCENPGVGWGSASEMGGGRVCPEESC